MSTESTHKATPSSDALSIRSAGPADLEALLRLEESGFQHDRLSRRNLRYLLTRGRASTLIAEDADGAAGYVMLLFHRGTDLARLYSIAVDPARRSRGVGRRLIAAAEAAAAERGCVSLRLEVHVENTSAQRLYRDTGFRDFGRYSDYYEDHGDALRMEKRLTPTPAVDRRTPYYRQTLEFTCGPAALIMAMRALDPEAAPSRRLELRLWREATSVFMTSGHGGCGPYGLALAAARRDIPVSLYVRDMGEAMFVDSVRDPEKKAVMREVEKDFREQLEELGIPLHDEPLNLDTLEAVLAAGGVPIVLISLYRLHRERAPHWVVVTGMDDHHVYVHDPYVDEDRGRTELDCQYVPIRRSEFVGMARYGRAHQRAAVVIGGSA